MIIISIYPKFAKLILGPGNHTSQLQMASRKHLSRATNSNMFLGWRKILITYSLNFNVAPEEGKSCLTEMLGIKFNIILE